MPLADLLRSRIIVAPMAGGPSSPELVIAAARAGALGYVAAGYKTVEAMQAEIAAVRAGRVHVFGVNLFVPGSPCQDTKALASYVQSLGPQAGQASWDDDGFAGKVTALLASPPPLVSFTFGCPDAAIIAAFRDVGTTVVVTVTSPAEALAAKTAGADALCGHRRAAAPVCPRQSCFLLVRAKPPT